MELSLEILVKGIGSVHCHCEQPWTNLRWIVSQTWRSQVRREAPLAEHIDGEDTETSSSEVDRRCRCHS
jgi:hypothetical protein